MSHDAVRLTKHDQDLGGNGNHLSTHCNAEARIQKLANNCPSVNAHRVRHSSLETDLTHPFVSCPLVEDKLNQVQSKASSSSCKGFEFQTSQCIYSGVSSREFRVLVLLDRVKVDFCTLPYFCFKPHQSKSYSTSPLSSPVVEASPLGMTAASCLRSPASKRTKQLLGRCKGSTVFATYAQPVRRS